MEQTRTTKRCPSCGRDRRPAPPASEALNRVYFYIVTCGSCDTPISLISRN